MRSHRKKLLSPVLADEQLVGEGLTRRVRVVLISVVIAFVLTNASSYLIGQAIRADAGRDTRTRVDALEREFTTDLEERRRQRDAETARQDRELRQLRADACTLADRVQPRDEKVAEMRRRYGCTGEPGPAASRPADGRTPATGTSRPAPGAPPAAGAPRPGPADPGGPSGPGAPAPSPAPPAPEPDDGLICLPVLGCVF